MPHRHVKTSRRAKRQRYNCRSGKKRYRSKDEATDHLFKIKKKSEESVIPVRAYLCGQCKGWHLTSQEKNYEY